MRYVKTRNTVANEYRMLMSSEILIIANGENMVTQEKIPKF